MNYDPMWPQQQFWQQTTPPPCCKFCGLMICGPTTIWNSYERACKCSVAERKQLTEEDIRKIIREELARFKADTEVPYIPTSGSGNNP